MKESIMKALLWPKLRMIQTKVDHGILLRKLREIGISGNLGIWFYNFLAHRSQYVRLPGGVSDDSSEYESTGAKAPVR